MKYQKKSEKGSYYLINKLQSTGFLLSEETKNSKEYKKYLTSILHAELKRLRRLVVEASIRLYNTKIRVMKISHTTQASKTTRLR